jgi:hypothetical protein
LVYSFILNMPSCEGYHKCNSLLDLRVGNNGPHFTTPFTLYSVDQTISENLH